MPDTIKRIYPLISQGAKITTDSRLITNNSIFVALKGKNFDGNDFAMEAVGKGALLSIVDNPYIKEGKNIVKTHDCLDTLHELARHHRLNINIPVIGITGSNGKTTTKELVSTVLAQKFKTLYTQGNYNNHIGLPVTILNIDTTHEIAVIEMGANHLGEIDLLCSIAMPTVGMITNIGKAHIEGFGSEQNVIVAKTELYRYLHQTNGVVFLNVDNEILLKHKPGTKIITYGSDQSAQYQGKIIEQQPFVKIQYNPPVSSSGIAVPAPVVINTRLVGNYNFENIMAAVAIGHYFGVTSEQIQNSIQSYSPANNRSQFKNSGKNHLIMDAYNANPTSMMAALQNFFRVESPKKIIILGDMLELGYLSEKEHNFIFQKAIDLKPEKLLLIGSEFSKVATDLPYVFKFLDCETAYNWMKNNPVIGYTILIKGSRGMQLEKLETLL